MFKFYIRKKFNHTFNYYRISRRRLLMDTYQQSRRSEESLMDYTSENRFHLAHMIVRAHMKCFASICYQTCYFGFRRCSSKSRHILARARAIQYDVLISRNRVKANLHRGKCGSLRNLCRRPTNDEGSNSRERVFAKETAVGQSRAKFKL